MIFKFVQRESHLYQRILFDKALEST